MGKILPFISLELKNAARLERRAIAYSAALILIVIALVLISFKATDERIYSVGAPEELAGILQANPRLSVGPSGADLNISERVSIRGSKGMAAFKESLATIQARNDAELLSLYESGQITFEEMKPLWIKLVKIEPSEATKTIEDATREDITAIGRMEASLPQASARQAIENALTKTDYDQLTTPEDLNKVFPLKSILIALLLITPMIFITTSYNNSFFDDKINRKASLIFAAPARRYEAIIGKSLPYFALCMGVLTAIVLFFTREPLAIALILPPLVSMAVFYFSLNFMLTVLSRSYKEMSFLKTSLGSVFIGFVLFPTLFLDISDIAFISPVATIVHLVEHGTLEAKLYLFSFLPVLLVGVAIFYFFSFLYQEEHYYSEKGMAAKIGLAIQEYVRKPRHVLFLTIATFPLVLLIEIVFLMLASLPSQEMGSLFILLIIVAATAEEFFKNIGIYIAYRRNADWSPWKLGFLSGAGFALAEKALLLLMIPVLLTPYYRIVLPALIVPFLFHSLTCVAFAHLAKRKPSLFWLIVPISMHMAYGLIVFRVLT